MKTLSKLTAASLAILVAGAGAAMAVEYFVPYGHTYGTGTGPLPYLNSPQDRLNGQADIYQTEIWRKQLERKLFESDMQRFINHDLRPGVSSGPLY